MGQLIILAIFAVLMYVLLIMPQQKRMKAQQALLGSLKEGDHVLTTSGVYGNIVEFEGPVLWLEVAKGVEIKVAREAVTSIVGDTDAGATDDDGEPAKKSKLEKFQDSLTNTGNALTGADVAGDSDDDDDDDDVDDEVVEEDDE